MRTYLILKAKARQFAESAAIQALLAEIRAEATLSRSVPIRLDRQSCCATERSIDRRSPRGACPTSAWINWWWIC